MITHPCLTTAAGYGRSSLCFLALLGGLTAGRAADPEFSVKLWEEPITLPTYEIAPPDPNPRFYQGRTYQGARATFYPYPVMDRLTDNKADKEYRAVYLENPYIKISVLPELGGRIFSATDKSNGYDFFYRQHVIKPALIGMLGAWISGGVEWNVPHHHRATSFMPVDYTAVTNPDGSKTLWVGETELRHGLKWRVGLTLYPDRSYIEMSMKVFNGTPLSHPILFWINPAVHANENYQVLFPPSTQWAVQHAKPEFASWPIAHQVYGGTDYRAGVDISWWKNHTSPVSFFAWNCEEDWFGGYDHGRQAGVIQWSDHHVAPGKKFFEWGNGPEGEMWSQVLSDNDGPYLELMAGAWSDNQPDYSWLQPGEAREWKHWWYPVRDLGGVKNASRDAALNLDLTNGVARLALNTTRRLDNAQLVLERGGQRLFEKTISVSPAKPFRAEVPVADQVEPIRITLRDSSGQEVLSYQSSPAERTPMPKPVERPKPPRDYATADELYFTGQRIEQLYSPAFEAQPYYEEMLRRDPGDYRANTALGILLCRQWRMEEAAARLSNAVARATANYVRPKDGEAFYYLGVALQGQGQQQRAYEAFYRAAWSQGWSAPAYTALAQIELGRSHLDEALDFVERSLLASGHNPKALGLKMTVLRKRTEFQTTQALAQSVLATDPLDFRARNELRLIQKQLGLDQEASATDSELTHLMRGDVQAHLELGIKYAGQGCWAEANDILDRSMAQHSGHPDPMVYYCRAEFSARSGNAAEAAKWYRLAGLAVPDYCFPGRYEEAAILREALRFNPKDARAAYYLGNALYDRQPTEAIQAWEQSRELDPNFALVHRNLGLGYAQHEKNVGKAVASLEKAVELNPNDARLSYELDVQYESGATPLAQRLDRLSKHRSVVEQRDDATTRLIVLLTAAGHADEALQLLRDRHFHNWEGSGELHDVYVNACLQQGSSQLHAGKPELALRGFEAALEYPRNQEVGRSKREPRVAEIFYHVGLAKTALGTREEATSAYEKAAAGGDQGAPEQQYFKGLALQQLGKPEEARPIFEKLLKQGVADLERGSEAVDYFAKFGEKRAERLRLAQAHYVAGLGELGQGHREEAASRFKQVLELNPAHLGALSITRDVTP